MSSYTTTFAPSSQEALENLTPRQRALLVNQQKQPLEVTVNKVPTDTLTSKKTKSYITWFVVGTVASMVALYFLKPEMVQVKEGTLNTPTGVIDNTKLFTTSLLVGAVLVLIMYFVDMS